jgi:hypothetical protein
VAILWQAWSNHDYENGKECRPGIPNSERLPSGLVSYVCASHIQRSLVCTVIACKKITGRQWNELATDARLMRNE